MTHDSEKDVLGENLRRALRAGDEQVERSCAEFLRRLERVEAPRRRPAYARLTVAASLFVCAAVLAAILSSGGSGALPPAEIPAAPAAQEKKAKDAPPPDEAGLKTELGRLKEALGKTKDKEERGRIQAAIDNLQVELARAREGKPEKGAAPEMKEKTVKKGSPKIDELTRAIEKNPADGASYAARAEEYLKTKRWDLGAQDARKAVELLPKDGRAHWVLGQACRLLQLPEESEKAFARAVQLDPKLAGEIDHYKRTSKTQEELNALYGKMKMTTDPGERARMEMKAQELGQELKLLSQGDRTMVNIKEIELRLQANPDDAAALCDRAAWHLDHGKADPALKDLERALELKPDFALAYLKRAVAHAMKGDMDRAWKDVKRGEELDPKNMKVVEQTQGAIKKLYGAQKDSQRPVSDLEQEIVSLKDRLEELRGQSSNADLSDSDRQRAAKEAARVQGEIDRLGAELKARPPESQKPAPKIEKKK